ncbi:hypothetical protein DB30_03812 [Enhygromyxa salina]|uniref:Uncharacterized protein n=1 Tax=Enhygromyxa salina TaxID=215803 RepID=A0A0C2D820_9BACT|nr:hypothetical protein [Enhygromyxa salina]KIG19256.1 hypothetical protein DB30_03812 [Enhygromyxa salina]
MEPVIVVALFVFGGLFTYTACERRHRARWVRFERREIASHVGPFRQSAGSVPTRDVVVQNRAPKLIRRTALWSIYMGQMAVPGGLLGLVGLFVAGIGLVSIPGLILAVRIWRVGYALLRRDPGAAAKARQLCTYALVLNAVGVTLAMILPLAGGTDLLPVAATLVIYGGVSYAHAIALRRCAELLETDSKLRTRYESGAYTTQAQQFSARAGHEIQA